MLVLLSSYRTWFACYLSCLCGSMGENLIMGASSLNGSQHPVHFNLGHPETIQTLLSLLAADAFTVSLSTN